MKDNKKENLETIYRGIAFVCGVVALALCYNLFLSPNNLVVGGMSGLGVVFKKLFGWNDKIFIYVSSIFLLFVSYPLLGREDTIKSVVGSLLYPFMVSVTSPLCEMILSASDLRETSIIIFLAAVLYGVASGLIYRLGFDTGGGDIVTSIMSKYLRISMATACLIFNFCIVLLAGLTYGISAFVYSAIIVVVSSIIIDKVENGVSDSKVFYISTDEYSKIEKMIKKEFKLNFTTFNSKANLFNRSQDLIMVVVSNFDYFNFKTRILEVDPKAFLIVYDCYEVRGSAFNKKIPF